MQRTKTGLNSILVLILLMLSTLLTAQETENDKQKSNLPDVIWRDPGNIASLNLLYGVGGKEDAPDPSAKFTFIKEDLQSSNPKFDIEDDHGVQWKVKLGQETQAETAATRLLGAAGYFVDSDYYLAKLKVAGIPELHHGKDFVSAGGMVHGARLERKQKDVKKLGTWDWFHNPFLGKRELNGLKAMMSLLNNWDLKEINNSIYEIDGERRYLVTDLGASFGNTGSTLTRSKGSPKDYANSKFIVKVTPGFIDFVMHSRPFFLTAIDVPYYRERTKMEEITKHVPRADAKWLGNRLSMLSEEQIRDCFRAAGFAPEEIDVYTKIVKKRIAQLNSL
jgi:hypothetical protein